MTRRLIYWFRQHAILALLVSGYPTEDLQAAVSSNTSEKLYDVLLEDTGVHYHLADEVADAYACEFPSSPSKSSLPSPDSPPHCIMSEALVPLHERVVYPGKWLSNGVTASRDNASIAGQYLARPDLQHCPAEILTEIISYVGLVDLLRLRQVRGTSGL